MKIESMITRPQFHQSVAGFLGTRADRVVLNETYTDLGLIIKQTDYTIMRYVKYAAGTATYAMLAIGGAIESFFRAFLATMAKTVTFFVPKQYAATIDAKIVHPLIDHMAVTLFYTASSASYIVTQFMAASTRKKVDGKIYSAFCRLYDSKFVNGARNIHINGFVTPEKPKKFVITSETPKTRADGFFTKMVNAVSSYIPAKVKGVFSN